MLKYILQRLLQGLLVMLALYTIVFFLVGWMPGDPFSSNEKNISPEVRENMKKAWGLDQPLWKQYLIYPKNLITEGSLGVSTEKNRPVWDIIIQSFPASLILGISALFIAVGIGVPIGILSATRRNTAIDYGGMAIAMIGICIPSFIIGPVLQLTLAAKIPALKIAGWGHPLDIILPSITLGLGTAAYLARLTRGSMLEVLNQDYIRTAKAKGLKTFSVVIKHALRGGLLPSVAFIGPAFAALISGSFIVETIFQVPGMGQHFVNAAIKRDPFVLRGVVLFYGLLIVIMNLAADLIAASLNPRIRLEKT